MCSLLFFDDRHPFCFFLKKTPDFKTVQKAASDARFQNLKGNNWSGPPEGLTFQRAIRALENYGHHAEVRQCF